MIKFAILQMREMKHSLETKNTEKEQITRHHLVPERERIIN